MAAGHCCWPAFTVFLAASVACALAASAGQLIAARAALGLGAGLVFPLALAVVSAAFSETERPKAIGALTAAVAAGLPFGPVLGGLLLQHFSWHSVFWINVPAVGLALAASAALVPRTRPVAAARLDVPGLLLSATGVTALVGGIITGPQRGWDAPVTLALLSGALVLLAVVTGYEHRAGWPLADAAMFADRRFSWGTAATVAVSVALFGILFVVPQYLQSVLGESPVTAGLRLLPMMAGLLAGGAVASPAARLAGTALPVAAGLAALTSGLVVLSQVQLASGYGVVAAGLALCGAGTGAAMAVAMDAVLAAAGGGEAGAGAAVNSALRQVGGAVAVAVAGSVLASRYGSSLQPALRALPAGPAATARASVTEAMRLAARLPDGGAALRAAAGAAFLHAMSFVLLGCAAVTAAAAAASLRYLPGRRDGHAVRDDNGVTETEPDWRQRKKTATRDRIRASALRLFTEQGYDATTVEQIATDAGVSHMTFFRYFPAKESVAIADSYDPLIVGLLRQTPASWPLVRRIRAALLSGLRDVYAADRDTLLAQNRLIVATPALRERLWASQLATQQVILDAVRADAPATGQAPDAAGALAVRVTVAACVAAASTAVLSWVENDGAPELPDLIEQAFDTLAGLG